MQHADALSRAPVSLVLTTFELQENQHQVKVSNNKKIQESNGIKKIVIKGVRKIIVPTSLQDKILYHYHDENGHPGKNKTIKLIHNYYWWWNSYKDIKAYVSSCNTCQLGKNSSSKKIGLLSPMDTPKQPLDFFALDTIVLGSAADQTKNKYIQTVIDLNSRYLWAFPTLKNTTQAVIRSLELMFITFKPKVLLTDRGRNFISAGFERFLERHNVRHSITSSYHPECNGAVERVNGTVGRRIRLALFENPKLKWHSVLPRIVDNYKKTPHESTGFTPKFLLLGTRDTPEAYDDQKIDLEKARQMAYQKSNERSSTKIESIKLA